MASRAQSKTYGRFAAETGVGRYWLSRCIGFEVRAGRRTLGTVCRARAGLHGAGTQTLLVARRRRVLELPVERVAEIDPWAEVVIVAARAPRSARPQVHRARLAGIRATAASTARARALAALAAEGASSAATEGAAALERAVRWLGPRLHVALVMAAAAGERALVALAQALQSWLRRAANRWTSVRRPV